MRKNVQVAPWVARVMKWDFGPKAQEIALTAGLGAGKTRGLVQAHYHLATVVNSKSKDSWFTEPTANLVKMVALPAWREHLSGGEEENGLGLVEGEHFKVYDGSPYRVVFNTRHGKHTVWLPSCENASKLVGANISHATIDEPGQISLEAKTKIFDRVRCSKAGFQWAKLLGGTPEGLHHWYADQYNIQPWELIGKKFRMQLATWDNPFHNSIEAYIDNLLEAWAHAPNRLLAYLQGEFVDFTSGSVFQFSKADHVKHVELLEQPRVVYLTFDFNAFPLAWCLAFQPDPHSLHFFKSSNGQNRNTLRDECIKLIKIILDLGWINTKFVVYGDRSGFTQNQRSSLNDFEIISSVFRAAGIECIIQTPPDVVPQTDSAEDVNRLLARNLISFEPKGCEQLISSVQKTLWNKTIRKIDKPANDTWTHWGDALRYLVYWLVKNGQLDYRTRKIGVKQL